MHEIVITGAGCVTPIGIGRLAFEEGLRRGRSGVGQLTQFDAAPYGCRVAAEIEAFDPLEFMDPREVRSLPRVVQLAVAASRLAMGDAGAGSMESRERIGIVVGTSSGPIAYSFEQQLLFIERGVRRMHPSSPAFGHNGAIASECAIQLDVHGPVFSVSSACASSTDAVGLGMLLLRTGEADAVIAGGSEAPLTPSLFAAFDRLRLMPTSFNSCPSEACRPFDVSREGMVLGEGAAMLVLERYEDARRRGARPLAEVAGYGSTCDAKSHFHQEPSGRDALRAIASALRNAGVAVEDIDYINAHGTGTRENDAFEAGMLRRLLASRVGDVPVSSSKAQLGHSLGASGAIEVMAVIAGMRGGFAPMTANLRLPDPACDLLHVMGGVRDCHIRIALSTSFGFGSRNAALVLRGGDV